uniref:Uncharacterized protein n=1 Tax=Arundo donax TaxID=35708 RepID=A0A0A9GNP8_ARUDO
MYELNDCVFFTELWKMESTGTEQVLKVLTSL